MLKHCIVVAGLLLGGCSRRPVARFEDFRREVMALSCDRAVRCGVIGASERATCRVPDLLLTISPTEYDPDAAISADRWRIDEHASAACLSALSQEPCDAQGHAGVESVCRQVLIANLSAGASCLSDEDCTRGGCDRPFFGCRGVCVNYPPLGGACEKNAPPARSCDPRLAHCDYTNGICVAGRLDDSSPSPPDNTPSAVFLDAGDACDPNLSTQRCPDSQQCLAGTCTARPVTLAGLDQPCDALPCIDGLYCDAKLRCAFPIGDRGACDPSIANMCITSLVCDAQTLTCWDGVTCPAS